ncbi:MAG: response regulator [Symploca sp. SIO2C1]|nr:response regulator [Symploca sp. SIO2C1]
MNPPVIICVDDEQTILDSLKIELEEALGDEYLIEVAQDGEEALELLSELLEDNYEVALVISDYIMPGMKGDELLKRIHAISPKTLKIMLTGQADVEAVGNAINYAKLYRYIPKPWQTQDLSLTVTEAVYSYFQDKRLAKKTLKLHEVNQALEQANQEQATLITQLHENEKRLTQLNQALEEANSKQATLIAQLHENEHRLSQFLEAIPVGVFVVDVNGKSQYVNSRAEQLLGKGIVANTIPEQFREVYQVYLAGTQQLCPQEQDPILLALQGESVTIDDLEIHQEDKIIPIEVWSIPIYDQSGNIAYAIIAFQDITERKEAEIERQEFMEQLFEVNGNLELALNNESKLTDAAERFVPKKFLSILGHQSLVDVQLGEAVQQDMSVLFADIRSFTTLSESMTPQDNFNFINAYLSRMSPVISEYQGFIDKYIGDAIMALFSGEADNAVKAGIAMLYKLVEYNQHRANSSYIPINIGIGINTGSLMLGTVGEQNRMDGTVISDAVNVASRLEKLTKCYGVPLLISQQTFVRLKDQQQYAVRFIDRVQVKGKSQLVTVYEVFDADEPRIKEGKLVTKSAFEEAWLLYNQQSFRKAAQLFADCLQQNPGDNVAQIYLERCQEY